MPNPTFTPSFTHGKLAQFFMDIADLSPYLNSVDTSRSMDTAETSAFGTNAKTYIAGQADATLSVAGMFDGSPLAVGPIFEQFIGSTANTTVSFPVTFTQSGALTVGKPARLGVAKQTSFSISSPVGDVVSVKGEVQLDGGSHWGKVLNTTAPVSALVTGTATDWGTDVPTWTGGGEANLHVTANTRNTATAVKLQHSTDNSVWVDLGPTQNVSAGQTVALNWVLSGSINRYVRAVITPTAGTGTITAVVAFART